jgi:outer membrane receptor protein involved in Fe transport
MSSVVRLWSATGRTRIPELRFSGDGGNYGTGHGFASLAGARGAFDYNLFADHFTTDGLEINDEYWNTSQGGNVGWAFSPRAALRVRARHSNNRSGVQSFWNFNGQPLLPPDSDQFARQNNFLASAELALAMPGGWQHRLTAFEYNHRRTNVNPGMEPGRDSPLFGPFDFPFSELAVINRAGFDYQGDFAPRAWARTTFGYQFEDENGFFDSESFGSVTRVHGLRRNHEVFGQQFFSWDRLTLVGGARFVHNESFGDRVVPRVSATFMAWRGRGAWSGTRLRAGYSEGIKAPTMPESFASGPFIIPNPGLEAEETRSFEAGLLQDLWQGKYGLSATYYDNRFRNQVAFSFDPMTFLGQFVNVNRARAHGAEIEFHGRPTTRWSFDASYVHTSTRILTAPFAFDPLLAAGRPLLRRPRHAGSLLVTYAATRWGANLGGSFVGRRPDSDFLGFGIEHAAGYARWDAGGWYALHPRVTVYANIENLFDRNYEEVAGYPALGANVRAGFRFRIGGE